MKKAEMAEIGAPREVSQGERAELIGRTRRQVYNLTVLGVLPGGPGGGYPVPESIARWTAYLSQRRRPVDRLERAIAAAELAERRLAKVRAEIAGSGGVPT